MFLNLRIIKFDLYSKLTEITSFILGLKKNIVFPAFENMNFKPKIRTILKI